MSKRILVFGDVIDDIVAVPTGAVREDTDTPSSIRHRPGGSAANAAAWLGWLGAEVDFVGRVGASDLQRHSQYLRDAGVRAYLAADSTLPTGTIVVVVDGQRRTMLTDRGANAQLTADHVTDELLASAGLLHFTGYSIFNHTNQDAIERLFARAKANQVAVSIDPASAGFIDDFGAARFLELIRDTALLFPNLDEGRALTGLSEPDGIAASLVQHFPLVALTLGEAGVIVARQGFAPVRYDAVLTRVVDPTGAGDAFCAGFLSSWVASGNVTRAAKAGMRSAARAVTVVGGRPLT